MRERETGSGQSEPVVREILTNTLHVVNSFRLSDSDREGTMMPWSPFRMARFRKIMLGFQSRRRGYSALSPVGSMSWLSRRSQQVTVRFANNTAILGEIRTP